MKTIVFASQKGGSSKSMLCRCQAVAAEQAGDGPVALVDTDRQGTTSKWWDRRQAETPLLLTVEWRRTRSGEEELDAESLEAALRAAKAGGIAYVFIDTQGALTSTLPVVAAHADFIVIPVKASPDDIDAIPNTLEIVEPLKRPFAFMLTQVKQQALITGAAKLNVDQFGLMCPIVMGDRVDYPGAVGQGLTVLETDPHGRSAGEMMEMWDFIKENVHRGRPSRRTKAA